MTNTKIVLTFLLFAALGFFIGFSANAYEVPKDAVIKVFDKDGKQIGEMSRSEYKVVRLGTSQPVTKVEYTNRVEVPVEVPDESYKLSLSLGGGVGNSGYTVDNDGSKYTVTDRQKPVGTLGGCITRNGSGVCLTGSTNDTYLMNFLIPLGDLD